MCPRRVEPPTQTRAADPPVRILRVRGRYVILDEELARLYGVETRVLVQAVKRNPERFPADFMIALTTKEMAGLRSQSVISNGRGGRRTPPLAFSEHGVAMLASVLRSERAVRVNIEIIRSFVRLRRQVTEVTELAARLDELETRYDSRFKHVFDALRRLMRADSTPTKRIGF